MIIKQFLTLLVLALAFLVPSLSQAWPFVEPQGSLHKDSSSCWQMMTVQDQTCVGDDCPEGGTQLPPETEEEPDCE